MKMAKLRDHPGLNDPTAFYAYWSDRWMGFTIRMFVNWIAAIIALCVNAAAHNGWIALIILGAGMIAAEVAFRLMGNKLNP